MTLKVLWGFHTFFNKKLQPFVTFHVYKKFNDIQIRTRIKKTSMSICRFLQSKIIGIKYFNKLFNLSINCNIEKSILTKYYKN